MPAILLRAMAGIVIYSGYAFDTIPVWEVLTVQTVDSAFCGAATSVSLQPPARHAQAACNALGMGFYDTV